jgi:nitroreductase
MAEEIGLFEAMRTQRALRRIKPDPVPEELLGKVLQAAIYAPSGGNRQPWNFIVIRDAATKRKLGEWYLDAWNKTYGQVPTEQMAQAPANFQRVVRSADHLAHHIGEVPVMVLVCARAKPPPGWPAAASHYGSIFPAVQNILLAARGLGLAAVLTTLHTLHEQDVKQLLDIPEEAETMALIPIGYPEGKYGPTVRRPVDDVVYQETWGATGH